MSIYPVLPYVYQCIHKVTGKIYIGSRANKNQKLPSYLDLPRYRTSSKIVKPIFDEFDWFIVAEFFNGQDAYNFEQQLIHEQWQVSKEMSLNLHCTYNKKSWNVINRTWDLSEETKDKMSELKKGKLLSEEHKQSMRKPKSPRSEEHKQKLRVKRSEQTKMNMRKPRSEEGKNNIKASKRVEHSFLTPNGFVIENTTLKELCSQFNLSYMALYRNFRNNKPYKGFVKLL